MENYTPEEERQMADRSRRTMTKLLVFAIVMFFAALTSAYLVSMSSSDYWMSFSIPEAFYVSTAIIIASSGTMFVATWAVKNGRSSLITPMLALTLVLGAAFTWSQVKGWGELADRKLNAVTKLLLAQGEHGKDFTITRKGIPLVREGENFYAQDDTEHKLPLNADLDEFGNSATSYFHVLTMGHYAHIAFGLLSLLIMLFMALKGRYTATDHVGLWAGAVYWHFLGGLWIYLLLFLRFVH
ncbi:MAG TPA: hypothetical protein PK760_01875 [Flavobacteriales bacterium]|nr:hypothetical protein [Flavobacteriales bacterium]